MRDPMRRDGVPAIVAEIAAAAAASVVVIHWHLVPALFGGLVAYIISCNVQAYARREHRWPQWATFTLAGIVALAAIATLIASIFVAFRNADIGGLTASVVKGLEAFQELLPPSLRALVPGDEQQIREALADLLHGQGEAIRGAGLGVLHGAVHALLGSVIGVMLSFESHMPRHAVARRIATYAAGLVQAFRGVMVAQAKISAINASLTGLFLLGVMPLLGFPLPLSKTLVVLTFFVGLIPVLGNLVSNTAITLVALLVSPLAAAAALVFLVVVHKLEYFLNARIVGGQVGARAWELLIAMLVAEACFGVSGLVVAPVVYVWLRDMVAAD